MGYCPGLVSSGKYVEGLVDDLHSTAVANGPAKTIIGNGGEHLGGGEVAAVIGRDLRGIVSKESISAMVPGSVINCLGDLLESKEPCAEPFVHGRRLVTIP